LTLVDLIPVTPKIKLPVLLEIGEQSLVTATKSSTKSLDRKKGGAFLSRLDHLDVAFGHVRFHAQRILAQSRLNSYLPKVLPEP